MRKSLLALVKVTSIKTQKEKIPIVAAGGLQKTRSKKQDQV